MNYQIPIEVAFGNIVPRIIIIKIEPATFQNRELSVAAFFGQSHDMVHCGVCLHSGLVESCAVSVGRARTKNYPDDVGLDPVAVLKERMINELEKRLAPQNAIIKDQSDLYEELSQGFNAQMYFSLMADSALGESVYLIDQPEDQISQNAIKHSVLKEFRSIAQSRQVILVTHNPQFLVNLDVDNVIALSMEGGELCVRHGALEYECAEYSVLQVVADTVEGGLDTIKKRMKRYDKNS